MPLHADRITQWPGAPPGFLIAGLAGTEMPGTGNQKG
jgi:hypothetical protein